jgi:aryl-alcohol dehydrogenase-like predicted oxidoreductase
VALERPGLSSLQTVYNLLEQEPGDDFLARARESGAGIMARVPTSSGLLEGRYTEQTTFSGNDHRRHRRREWLLEGLKKVERLRFLAIEGERTMTQAALKWILHQPGIACVVPTVTTVAELEEMAAASTAPDLSEEELERVAALYASDFAPEPARV